VSSRAFKCRVHVGGTASGEAMFSRDSFTFDRAVDPRTGMVLDTRTGLGGASIRGKVLFYQLGKGSTAASSWLIEAIRLGNGPAAIVTERLDLAAIVGSSVAGILHGKTVPVLSGIGARVFAKAKVGSIASVEGDTVRVVMAD